MKYEKQHQTSNVDTNPHDFRKGIFYGVFAVFIWGTYLAVSRYALTTSTLEAVDIAFIRATVSGLIMLVWIMIKHKTFVPEIRQTGVKKMLVLACCVGPPFVFISVSGYEYAPLVNGGVLMPVGFVLAGLIFAARFLGDKFEPKKMIGVLIMLLGLGLLAGSDIFIGNSAALFGDFLFFLSGILWASFAVSQRFWQVQPVIATASVGIVSLLIYSPIYLMFFGFERLRNIAIEQLIIQGVVQGLLAGVIAMILFSLAVKNIGAARASLFPALLPITTLVVGLPLTGELLTYLQSIGTLVVLSGLVFMLMPKLSFTR